MAHLTEAAQLSYVHTSHFHLSLEEVDTEVNTASPGVTTTL